MAPPENSVTNTRTDCALTHQMVGCIKAISPTCLKSASAKLFLGLHTVLAPSGEERTLGEAAQVERAAWCCGQRNRNTPTSCDFGPYPDKLSVCEKNRSGSDSPGRSCVVCGALASWQLPTVRTTVPHNHNTRARPAGLLVLRKLKQRLYDYALSICTALQGWVFCYGRFGPLPATVQ